MTPDRSRPARPSTAPGDLPAPIPGAGVDAALAPILAVVQDVAGWLWARGWAERNAGNFSIDITDIVGAAATTVAVAADAGRVPLVPYAIPDAVLAGRALLVSATGARFRDTARDPRVGLLAIRIDDACGGYRVIWDPSEGTRAVTSELISHLVLQARLVALGSRRRAILHTHPTHLIALNHAPFGSDARAVNRALWSILPEVKVFVPEGVAVAPYKCPGSRALADATAEALSGHRAVLWDKHGAIAVESDLAEAFDLLDMLDKAARIYLACLAAGYTPRGLSALELAELAELAGRLGMGP